MAIVLYNDKPKGRFFRYRVNGAPQSVWVDGYSEVIIQELNDTSTMLNKVEKSKQQRVERLSNSNTLSKDLFVSRSKTFKDVSETIRWKPVVVNLNTGFNTYVFKKEGQNYVFASPPGTSLVIGADIRGSRLNMLSSYYNGTYTHNGFEYVINDSEITSIAEIEGEGVTALTWNQYSVTYTSTTQVYTTYTTGSTNVYDNGVQWFSSSAGTGTDWSTPYGGFHYSGSSVYVLNTTSDGVVDYSSVYSSAVAYSAYTLYNQTGTLSYQRYTPAASNPVSTSTVFYTDTDLTTAWNTSATYKYDVPATTTNRKLTLSNGVVTASNTYSPSSSILVNLSGNTGTTSTVYVESTQTVDEVGVYWFDSAELTSKVNVTGTYIDFSQDPNRYMSVSAGRVLSAGDITWGGGVSYTSWTVRDSGANILTIYTQQGDALTTVSTVVYANSNGTGSVTQGVYTYNDGGTNKNITVKNSIVTVVANAGR